MVLHLKEIIRKRNNYNSNVIVKSNDIEDLELFMEKLFDLFPKEMIREI